MKIAVFTDLFLPHVDGVTNSLVHLITQYKRMGHDVLVITPKTKGSNNIHLDGIEILLLPSVPAIVYPEFMLGFFSSKLLFKLRKFSPEIVHVIAPGPVGSMGLFYAKLVNIKSVATFHGYFMEPEYLRIIGIKNRGVKLAQKVLWRFTKTFYDRADRVITPSLFVKKDLESHNFSRPITAIKNAIDFSSVASDQKLHDEFMKKYKLNNKKVILYIGRVSIEKNIETLIKSFPFIIKEVPEAHLLIVGNGPDKERLIKLVSKLKLSSKVTFTGEIKNSDLVRKDVFSAGQVFATASHSEVQPVSIIEAMHFGLPIVAAKSRGLMEMIKDNGFLVSKVNGIEFSKPLIKLLKNENLRKSFSKESSEIAKEYSLEFSAQKHIKLYTNLYKNIEDVDFFRRVIKSRIIKTSKDLIFLAGIIHVSVLTYLFLTKEKLEYLNIFYILDLEKLIPGEMPSLQSFMLSAIVVCVGFVYFFLRNKKR